MLSGFGSPDDGRRSAERLRISEESLTIALTGALTGASVPMVRLHLLTLAATWGPDELLLDLSGVHCITSEGAEPLLEAQHRQHKRGAVLRLVGVSPPVLRFFRAQARYARLLIPPANDLDMMTGGPIPAPVTQRDRSANAPRWTRAAEARALLRSAPSPPADDGLE